MIIIIDIGVISGLSRWLGVKDDWWLGSKRVEDLRILRAGREFHKFYEDEGLA